MPCCAFLCFALISRPARRPLQVRPGNARHPVNLCSHLTPTANSLKKCPFQSPFRPQSQILRKNALFTPLCGGDHSRARKVKKYNQNITENHNEKSRDDFSRSGPRNRRKIAHFCIFSIKMLEKMRVRTNSAREK